MSLPPVKSNVPNLVPVQPPVGGAPGPVNNAPVGNPPAAPELLGEDPQAQAPRMPTGELVAKLDSLPAGLPLQDRRRPDRRRKSQVAAPAASSRCSDQPLGARASRPRRRRVSAICPSEARLSTAPCGLQYMN